MSAAFRALNMHRRILSTLAAETAKRGLRDGDVAERIGCGREFFNRLKNKLMHGGLLMVCAWACLVDIEIVAVRPQQDDNE